MTRRSYTRLSEFPGGNEVIEESDFDEQIELTVQTFLRGGTIADEYSCTFEFHKIGGSLLPFLHCSNEDFPILPQLSELFNALSDEVDEGRGKIGPDRFCEILQQCQFEPM